MTHIITRISADEVTQLRGTSLDAALVAFPAGQGHDRALALMDLYDDQAVVWLDHASLALDEDRLAEAAALATQAIRRHPSYRLAWIVRLAAELRLWEQARRSQTWPADSIAARLASDTGDAEQTARAGFTAALGQAEALVPDAVFIHHYAGRVALLAGDYHQALARFGRAAELSPQDARAHAAVAEAHYALRELEKAQQAAEQAVACDPTLPAANVWMARCLAQRDDARAHHYARCAVEQAPDWWLAHLAQAEAQIAGGQTNTALRSLGVAQALAPARREVRAGRGVLLAAVGAAVEAAAELEQVLAEASSLAPMTAYTARCALCRILFGARLYEVAGAQVEQLLALAPDDPWGLQFRAAVCAETRLAAGQAGDTQAIGAVSEYYRAALTANRGEPWIARDYLEYLAALAGVDAAIEAAAALRESYPDRGLSFVHGQLLARAERMPEAVAAMLEALGQTEAIARNDDLYEAIAIVVDSLGLEAGTTAVLASEGGVPRAARERALGLLLAERDGAEDQARTLLSAALIANPDDASATLRLAGLAEADTEREALYRRALMLAPAWSYARYRLALYLYQHERAVETLELTSGHASESVELMEIHARALLRVGRYEESAAAYAQTIAMAHSPAAWVFYYKWVAEDSSGQHQTALATAQQAVERFDEPSWYVQLGLSLTNLGRYDQARQAAEQGRAAGLHDLDACEIGYAIAWAQHDLAGALEIVDQALTFGPEQLDGELNEWERRRLRLLIDLERLDAARELIDARQLSPDGMGHAAWVAMDADHWPLLMELAEQALARDPKLFAGMFTRATALRELGYEEEAIEAYHELRQAHPAEHNAYEKLAFLLALDGRVDEALDLADRGVALGPFCYMAWAVRGYVYLVRCEDEKALDDLQAGWNRSDIGRRRSAHAFWWLLNALRGDTEQAAERRALAIAEAKTAIDRRHIAQIESLLAARLKLSTPAN